MNILVVGSGGREHALVWKISQSPLVSKLYCAPGNGGISGIAECVDIDATDLEGIVNFAKENNIDLTVVAPDDPLAMGLVDALQAQGLRAFGPNRQAAILEWSKVFAKDFMKKYNIPTASYEVFHSYHQALEYINDVTYPIVIKADGLALGKGVIIAQDKNEAQQAITDCMINKVFGESGSKIIIEEYLEGLEVSVLVFTDGYTVVPMISSQDHKKAFDNDKGPNTGGMGAFAPSIHYTEDVEKLVYENICIPTINAMRAENRLFKGVLYFGLMLTSKGPKLLEYNVRFGDPETQVLLPLLKTDLVEIFEAIIDGRLDRIDIKWEQKSALCVIMASGGYPKHYTKGYEITGLDYIEKYTDLLVFHAGTKKVDGKYYTNGGRVLAVTAIADSIDIAAENVYNHIDDIKFIDSFYRTDIGKKQGDI